MKYAICNETFAGWEHGRVCRFIAEIGYTGLEIAPFTLAARITDVPLPRRQEMGRQAEEFGIQIIGLHWLLAKTEGFHLTALAEEVRARTADYLADLARACRDLGGSLMVFGSPAQRNTPPGMSRPHAFDLAADTIRRALPRIADAGVTLCLEPLAPTETNFLNSCAEGLQLVEMLDHPSVRLHLDVKAMSSENAAVPDLIRRFGRYAHHFHANDSNRRGPGFGDSDFMPIFQALNDVHYDGWVSVEVFDYTPDPETIARESLRYMKSCEPAK
jgi:sugar phosphate isomerase/epimerase